MGASARADGRSAVHTHMTNSWNTPVEAFEHEYPVQVRAYTIRAGSGGRGEHNGGDGIVRELRFLEETDVTILSDRRSRGPYGLAGGESGQPGSNTLTVAGKTSKLEAKTRITAPRDSVLGISTPGGGGFGRPRVGRRPGHE
jgi:N-methylhydantoinase B